MFLLRSLFYIQVRVVPLTRYDETYLTLLPQALESGQCHHKSYSAITYQRRAQAKLCAAFCAPSQMEMIILVIFQHWQIQLRSMKFTPSLIKNNFFLLQSMTSNCHNFFKKKLQKNVTNWKKVTFWEKM